MVTSAKLVNDDAYQLLVRSLKTDSGSDANIPENRLKQLNDILVVSNHLTYKYVCINGLLGKAWGNCNPLVLQAGSELARPWDARSLCHKVVVPFEREYLENRLGGSNEPFLNKPARFPELSESNAVRAGRDKTVLATLINFLSFVDTKTPEDARLYLSTALREIFKIETPKTRLKSLHISEDEQNAKHQLYEFLSTNHQGQTLTLVTYALLSVLTPDKSVDIEPHKINQSGASSGEKADIDCYRNGVFVAGFEIKDKEYSLQDVQHARSKVTEHGGAFIFITRQKFVELNLVDRTLKPGSTEIVTIESLVSLVLSLTIPPSMVLEKIKNGAVLINATNELISELESILRMNDKISTP